MPHRVWRIAADTPDHGADDLSGKGAARSGGRWNRKGTPLVYTSTSMALACLETIVHLGGMHPLPLNRYLVEIEIPDEAWAARTRFDVAAHVGWDALPAGLISIDWGTQWAKTAAQLVAEVPSIVVPEESNILLNPVHPLAATLVPTKLRRWTYDGRLLSPRA
jgi:RES domain-containing protein